MFFHRRLQWLMKRSLANACHTRSSALERHCDCEVQLIALWWTNLSDATHKSTKKKRECRYGTFRVGIRIFWVEKWMGFYLKYNISIYKHACFVTKEQPEMPLEPRFPNVTCRLQIPEAANQSLLKFKWPIGNTAQHFSRSCETKNIPSRTNN